MTASPRVTRPLEPARTPTPAPSQSGTEWSAGIFGGAALLSVVAVVALWLRDGGVQAIADPGGVATTFGRLTGLVAADLLLVQVLLMARIPWMERAWGQDVLTRRHRLVGFASFHLMLAHVMLITIGYAQSAKAGLLSEAWALTTTYPGMLLAVGGTAALILVVATSLRAARRRLRYESWHLIHLYAYLGVGLALPHQLWTGADFLTSPVASVFWWGLWGTAAGAIVLFRLALPIARSAYHGMSVQAVVPEGPGLVSVVIRGRHLDRMGLHPGQYFHWRFLERPGWTRANPYSVSGMPRADRLRITARTDGDGGRRLTRLRPGVPVMVEGPYGSMTPHRRRQRDVLLIAAGVGITPMRGLAEQIGLESAAPGRSGYRSPSVVLLHRISRPADAIFGSELAELARYCDLRVVHLVGARSPDGSWLPGPHPGNARTALRQMVPDIGDRAIYLCGPPGWTTSVIRTLRQLRIPASAIHREEFGW